MNNQHEERYFNMASCAYLVVALKNRAGYPNSEDVKECSAIRNSLSLKLDYARYECPNGFTSNTNNIIISI